MTFDHTATAARTITFPDVTGTATILGNTSTGSGSVVLATSPTLVTPTLGVAAATTINKVTLTAPATGSTLTIAEGKTLTASNSLTLAGTDATTMTFPGSSDTVVTLAATQTLTNKTLTSPRIGTDIKDTGGNALMTLTATGSAVNALTLANAATGGNPSLTASGTDTNIGLNLVPKGTGQIAVQGPLSVRSGDNVVLDSTDATAGGDTTANNTYLVHDGANDRLRLYVDGVEVARFKRN